MNARGVPVGVAVRALRAVLPVAGTWRFRHPDDPGVSYRPRLPPGVYACWHEHLLPIAWWLSDRGFATLASEDRDGEIITRVLHGLGYAVARGSSTRGGAGGYRGLIRAARAGRPIILTCDGPRGPRRRAKPGPLRLAERTGLPLVPIGLGATHGARLRSWDRFLIPAPGSTVYVTTGAAVPIDGVSEAAEPPDHPDDLAGARGGASPGPLSSAIDALSAAIDAATARCEQVAEESRCGRPPTTRRGRATPTGPRSDELPGVPAPGLPVSSSSPRAPTARFRRLEGRVRRAWSEEPPPLWLRAPAGPFAAARAIRHALYDRGILATHRAPIPVVSVGGVTVGGSGKTPLAADVARRLLDLGAGVAILTRGYEDELALHRGLNPGARVWGHPDRVRLAGRAAAEGATVAVLDDGFQHRRLDRDLEILAIDLDALRRTNGRSLPAGPFRERPRKVLFRSDLIVMTSRSDEDLGAAVGEASTLDEIAAEIGADAARLAPHAGLARLRLESRAPVPANAAAAALEATPTVALTGVMKPNLFFAAARRLCATIEEEIALPDHGWPGPVELARVGTLSRGSGVLLTAKDFARFGPALENVPVWILPDRLTWVWGEAELDARLSALLEKPDA